MSTLIACSSSAIYFDGWRYHLLWFYLDPPSLQNTSRAPDYKQMQNPSFYFAGISQCLASPEITSGMLISAGSAWMVAFSETSLNCTMLLWAFLWEHQLYNGVHLPGLGHGYIHPCILMSKFYSFLKKEMMSPHNESPQSPNQTWWMPPAFIPRYFFFLKQILQEHILWVEPPEVFLVLFFIYWLYLLSRINLKSTIILADYFTFTNYLSKRDIIWATVYTINSPSTNAKSVTYMNTKAYKLGFPFLILLFVFCGCLCIRQFLSSSPSQYFACFPSLSSSLLILPYAL